MSLARHFAALLGVALWLVWGTQESFAHMDAVRVSLSQLFLSADLVTMARIDSVEKRSFSEDDSLALY